MELTRDQIREELFRRIDDVNVQHGVLEGFRVAMLDAGIVVAYNRNVRFFGTVEASLFNSIVVLLYSLYETRSDTVNFRTLLDAIAAVSGEEQAREYRQRISNLKPIIAKVCMLRNEAIGHQSTDRPLSETHTRANLLYSDVEMLLTETMQLFVDISSAQFGISSSFRAESQFASMAVLAALKADGAP